MKPKTWTLPKFALLQRRLGVGPAFTAGILEGIWHLAATFDPEYGRLPYDAEELTAWLGIDIEPQRLMTALIDGRWVDNNGRGLTVHDWEDHRPNYVKETLRKRDQRATSRGNVSQDSPRTVPGQSANVPQSAHHSDSDYKSDQLNQLTRKSLTEGEVAATARILFKAAGYRGDQGRWFWKAAALVDAGILSEADVMGLAGVAKGKSNPPKYFYNALKRNLADRGDDLHQLSERVTIVPQWPGIYPGD